MRTGNAWVGAILLAGSLVIGGCKNSDSEASTAVDPAVIKAQQELRDRRDALMKARQSLQAERDKVDTEMKKVAADGGDTTELAKQRAELDIKLDSSSTEIISQLSSKLDALPAGGAGGDKAAQIAAREAAAGSREKDFSTREQRMADRERAMAERERALAEREKTMCSGGTTTIVQAAPLPKDANIGRSDVVGLINRAHTAMGRKNLIAADLGAAGNLEAEANKAVNDGNWSKAYFAAQQFALAVDAIKIDRGFINAKVNRLQARLGSNVTPEQAAGMKEVLQKYGDGDFVGANKKLNSMWK